MRENFKKSLALIRKEEGGNDDDPHDHGGRTSRGIIQREWDAYRKTHPGLPADVWEAPDSAIDDIYLTQYWNPYCDGMPTGVDLMFFNICVNSGRQQAVKLLQRALGINADGMMGIVTNNAILVIDPKKLVSSYHDKIEAFYRNLAQFPRYGRGWLGRLERITTAAMALAANNAVPKLPQSTEGTAKAAPVAAPPPVSTQTATAGTAAGTVGSAISDQLQQASVAIQPLSDAFTWAKYICIGLTLICAGLAIYAIFHNRKTAEAV